MSVVMFRGYFHNILLDGSYNLLDEQIQRVPALHGFWDFEKTTLREICVSGTVE